MHRIPLSSLPCPCRSTPRRRRIGTRPIEARSRSGGGLQTYLHRPFHLPENRCPCRRFCAPSRLSSFNPKSALLGSSGGFLDCGSSPLSDSGGSSERASLCSQESWPPHKRDRP